MYSLETTGTKTNKTKFLTLISILLREEGKSKVHVSGCVFQVLLRVRDCFTVSR